MSRYDPSEAADLDLRAIFEDSVARWGFDRAERYLLELHKLFEILSQFSATGHRRGISAGGIFPVSPRKPRDLFSKNRFWRFDHSYFAPETTAGKSTLDLRKVIGWVERLREIHAVRSRLRCDPANRMEPATGNFECVQHGFRKSSTHPTVANW